MKRAVVALALALAACQRHAPLAVAPHRVPPQNLRVSAEPLDPNRIKGVGPFGDSVMLALEAGVVGDRVTTLLEVPKTDCVVVIARGSETVEDLDLFAYGEDGAALGSDEAGDRQPSLLICPPHPGRVVLAARIAQGHGLVAVGAQRVAPALAQKVAERYGVKSRAGTEAARVKAWPGLDALVAQERARVGGKFQDLRRVALSLDAAAPTTVPATVEGGRCVHGLFVPSEDVSHLDVAALDEQGRILGRAAGSGRLRTLVVCSPVTTDITFEVRPHSGRGLAVAALSSSVAGTESEIDAEVVRRDVYPSGDQKRELDAAFERLGRWGYEATAPLAKLDLQVGRRTSRAVSLGRGCTRLDVVGASPLRGVDARLWTDAGILRATGTGGGTATLFSCGAGKLRLDISALLAPGSVSVLAHREETVPPELTRAPLAGGRLVSRMVSRGVLFRADAIGKVTELALTAERLTTVPVRVPVDRCLDVNVAIEGPAAGVELRAVEQETDLELDSAVGESAASTRLCGYGRGARGSLDARIELRVVNSTATALLATRLLSPAD